MEGVTLGVRRDFWKESCVVVFMPCAKWGSECMRGEEPVGAWEEKMTGSMGWMARPA